MNNEIKLTLDPNAGIAAAEAPLAPAPSASDNAVNDAPSAEAAQAQNYLEDDQFSESERKVIEEFAKQIDIADSAVILGYGAAAQKKISDFSDTALGSVRNKDFGEVL